MADVAALTIVLDGDSRTIDCPIGSTLLDAAQAAGMHVPFACREGHCGACIVKVTAGTVDMPAAQGLSKRERDRGFILACQAVATSDRVTLDYDS